MIKKIFLLLIVLIFCIFFFVFYLIDKIYINKYIKNLEENLNINISLKESHQLKIIPNKDTYFETILISINDFLVNKFLNKKITYISIHNVLLKLMRGPWHMHKGFGD